MSSTGSDRRAQPTSGAAPAVTPGRRAAAVAVALLGVGLLAVYTLGTYSFTSTYGFDAGGLQWVDAAILLLVAGLSLLLLLASRRLAAARRPATPVVAVLVLAAFTAGAPAAAVLGGAAHERGTAAADSACSAQDQERLAAVAFAGYRDGPYGDPDGGCRLLLHPQTRTTPAVAVAELTAVLRREGWRPVAAAGGTSTLERDGAVMTVTAQDDGKTMELVLTLR